MTALSIFIVADQPFITFKNDEENGEYTFPQVGGFMVKVFGDSITCGIEFYSWTPSAGDGWTVTCHGEEIPEWLNIELIDGEEEGEFNNLVIAEVTADPLPEDVDYREAVVRFEIPGDYIDYKFRQGEKIVPDNGIILINQIIDVILGAQVDEATWHRLDINDDGEINIVDVDRVVSIILGNN